MCPSGPELSGYHCLQQQSVMQPAKAVGQMHSHVCRTKEHTIVGNCRILSKNKIKN